MNVPIELWTSCTTSEKQFVICKVKPPGRTIYQPGLFPERHKRLNSRTLKREFELSGLETYGELPIPKMASTTTTVNKQT